VSSRRVYYAAEGKHALYHNRGQCEWGGLLFADSCHVNEADLLPYKRELLQNVGNPTSHANFDTVIQHPNACGLYDVWSGADFWDSPDYLGHFTVPMTWDLP
jgi:hypothetical protein